jgi:hypothetical protein
MDERIRDYFDSIEAAFGRRRGAPLLLSPLDFEKAVEWYAAGVPAEAVEAGIAAYFERLDRRKVPSRHAVCLSFAERDVEKALAALRRAAVGRAAGVEAGPVPAARVEAFLESRARGLEGFAARPEVRESAQVLCRFAERAAAELRDLKAEAGGPEARLEAALSPLDEELVRLALLDGPPDLAEAWRREAHERLGDLAATLEPRILRQTLDRLAAVSALRHWGLDRLSLLYMEE